MSAGLIGINLAIAAAALAMCLLCLVQAVVNKEMGITTHRFLVVLFSVLVAYMALDLAGQVADDFVGPTAVAVSRALLFLESLTSSFATLVLMAFLLDLCGEREWHRNPIFRISFILWVIYLGMLVYNEFAGGFYSINTGNVYRRGPIYPLLLVPPLLIMLLSLVLLVSRYKRLSKKELVAIAAYIVIPAASMIFQMFSYGLYVIVLGTALGAFALFYSIQNDHAKRYYRAMVENSRLKSDIMLSQLQPHFLSNTLGAIGRLCRNDPEAKEAVGMFSRYLRGNIDAISSDALCSFERELDHAMTYLKLEQLRFGSDLNVVYCINCTAFLLPALTLQPLVENAVRHGIRGTEEGTGTVVVSSRALPDCWEIEIADDGAGFDPSVPPSDDRAHVGLSAVRERLRFMCGGTLLVESAPGKGTVVTVKIPKEQKEAA